MIKSLLTPLLRVPEHIVPSLDGLRSLAIILVFFTHSAMYFQTETGVYLSIFRLPFIHSGWAGVDMFFVLSGYLIGLQLWKDLKNKGTVEVKKFIVKRTFRIWPLFFFFLILFYYVLEVRLGSGTSIWPEIFFLSNYLGEAGVKGSWSLAVEEQFYIAAPALLIFFRKKSFSFHRKLLTVLLIAAPAIRCAQLILNTGSISPTVREVINNIYLPFHTHYDGLLFGLLLANISIDRPQKIINLLDKYTFWFAGLVILVGLRIYSKNLFNYSLLTWFFAFLLWNCLYKENLLTKMFSFKFWHYISKLSFGIYLSHHVMLHVFSKEFFSHVKTYNVASYSIFVLLSFIMTLLVTALTYVFIETPFLNIRTKMLGLMKKEQA